ncbi:MAG: type IV secretory system conjugative DNA transfer family protein [Acidimicrobiales bacterium]
MNAHDGDEMWAGLLVAAGWLVTVWWVAARFAGWVSGAPLGAGWGDTPAGIAGSVAAPGDPGAAWGAPGAISPGVYWLVVAAGVGSGLVVVVAVWSWWPGSRAKVLRSRRLGVVPGAAMASRRACAPVRVRGPVEGRFLFGRIPGGFAATEDPGTQSARAVRGRAKSRVGDRTSVMIFGPTRSGKTATVVPGVIEWDLPAVVSSVKADLMLATLERRRQIGEVFLFDPFRVAGQVEGVQRVSWSPISCSSTVPGAIAAAKTLADAASIDDVTSGGFWADRGATLLWPMLFAAAVEDRSMSDVVRWLVTQDGTNPQTSEIRRILTTTVAAGGVVGVQATAALHTFNGWAALDPRPRSDQSSTAQSLVSAWADPYAAASSDPSLPGIDIGRVLAGRNTLYIVQPLGRGDQYAPLFGGLFGDLIRDQTYRVAQAAGGPIGPLLAVLDEAGNTPLRWLPDVASTCAGIGVQLVTIWQDRAQIDQLYGPAAQSVLNNHATKVFFAGQSDPATLEYASLLCGDEDVTTTSTSADHSAGGGGARRSVSMQVTSNRLVPVEVLRQIPNGTALLVHGTLPPMHMTGRRVNEERPDPTTRPLPPPRDPSPSAAVLEAAKPTVSSDIVEHLTAATSTPPEPLPYPTPTSGPVPPSSWDPGW